MSKLIGQFSKKKYKWQIPEVVFNILNHKGNANQNGTEILSIPVRMAIKKTNNKCWQRCVEKGTLI
jgi:hypothetical protein